MFFVGNNLVSFKRSARTREASPFIAEIVLACQSGEYVFFSHKAWLNSIGSKISSMTKGSLNNGPRYTLARHLGKGSCVAGNLEGEELAQVAEAEGLELVETDIIYSCHKVDEEADLLARERLRLAEEDLANRVDE